MYNNLIFRKENIFIKNVCNVIHVHVYDKSKKQIKEINVKPSC